MIQARAHLFFSAANQEALENGLRKSATQQIEDKDGNVHQFNYRGAMSENGLPDDGHGNPPPNPETYEYIGYMEGGKLIRPEDEWMP